MNKSLHRIYVVLFIIVGVGATLLLGVYGYKYYTTPIEERFFQPHYDLLKPSGMLGTWLWYYRKPDDDFRGSHLYDTEKGKNIL